MRYLFTQDQQYFQGKPDGYLPGRSVYFEVYGMTGDPEFRRMAETILASLVKRQTSEGYFGNGEQLTAIALEIETFRAAKLAGLEFPDDIATKASSYLDAISRDEMSNFVWNKAASNPVQVWFAPLGLVTRMFVNQWDTQHPAIQRAIPRILDSLSGPTAPQGQELLWLYADGSAFFYAVGGPIWKEQWNPQVRQRILQLQLPKGHPDAGAFAIPSNDPNTPVGKANFVMTCDLLKTLEVYYRYPRDTYDGVR